jgi:hypothetical protein
MAKDILSWNDVKERYLEFHRMDKFTENMAIDVDFGYWLVNNCIIPDVSNLAKFCQKIAKQEDCPPEFIEIVNKEFWNLI